MAEKVFNTDVEVLGTVTISGSPVARLIDLPTEFAETAIEGFDGLSVVSGSNSIELYGFYSEFVAASGSLQTQLDDLDLNYATDAELTSVSGHLQAQLDSIDFPEFVETALIGSDGITIVSGSNTTTISGFYGEFVAASGTLQNQFDTLDLNYATDAELVAVSGHLQTQIDGIDFPEFIETALTGSDGITIISGSNTTDIQGFYAEFVTSSGHLQNTVDGKIGAVVEDPTPTLGGNLDADNFDISNIRILTAVTGTMGRVQGDSIIAGDPGIENSGINIGGNNYQSSLKVSDIGGTQIAQLILHRHSTSLPPYIVSARSNSDTSGHSPVSVGDTIFGIIPTGRANTYYLPAASVEISVDSGTVSDSSMPGRITFSTTKEGEGSPSLAVVIDSNQNVTIEENLTAASGTFTEGITVGTSTTYVFPNEVRSPLGTFDNLTSGGLVVAARNELLTVSGSLQQQFDELDLNYATDAELVVVSGHLQSQLDNLDNVYATDAEVVTISGHLQGQLDSLEIPVPPAIIGADGVTVTSGSNTVEISGDNLLPRDGTRPMTADLNFDENNAVRVNRITFQDQGTYGDGATRIAYEDYSATGGALGITVSGELLLEAGTFNEDPFVVSYVPTFIFTPTTITAPGLTIGNDGSSTGPVLSLSNNGLGNSIEAGNFIVTSSGDLVAASGVFTETVISPVGEFSTSLTISGVSVATSTDVSSLQNQIDAIEFPEFVETALIGSDGIVIVSGSGTVEVQGFYNEFVATSGSLQSQIITDHGGLDGLTDDDHQQYILADTSRAFDNQANSTANVKIMSGVSMQTESSISLGNQGTYNWKIARNEDGDFSIRDEDNGDIAIVTVENNAPAGMLRLTSTGRVGVRTFTPAEALDVVGSGIFTGSITSDPGTGNANATLTAKARGTGIPAFRLTTNGQPIQWRTDISSNNFRVVDEVTSTAPLVVESGTPNNLLVLDNQSNGRVGVRTASPATDFHVVGSGRIDGLLDVGIPSPALTTNGLVRLTPGLTRPPLDIYRLTGGGPSRIRWIIEPTQAETFTFGVGATSEFELTAFNGFTTPIKVSPLANTDSINIATGGLIGINGVPASGTLHVFGSGYFSSFVKPGGVTNTQKNALPKHPGAIIWNTTSGTLNVCDGVTWRTILTD